MVKRICVCVFMTILILLHLLAARSSEATSQAGCNTNRAGTIEPGLREKMLASPGGKRTFLVYLKEQADLGQAPAIKNWKEKGDFVVRKLKDVSHKSQRGILAYLEHRRQSGQVDDFRQFSIVNAVKIKAGLGVLDALAALPEVSYIEEEKVYALPPEQFVAEDITPAAIEWNISKIRADQVWGYSGILGDGIIVANIDTGVRYDHPALVNQYRGNLGGGAFNHSYNWWDPSIVCPLGTPCDNNSHGTHTMGTMCGYDGGSNQIGVAPGAKWIACKGCSYDTCSTGDLLECAEFMLAPWNLEGGNPDPARRPHIVNSSWGDEGGICDLWYEASVLAWRAAGIFPAFSAGNSGPGLGTISNPGSYASSFTTGATDINDSIYYFGSRGPSPCTSEIKPDVTAPGVNVRSSVASGGYASGTGTSMASPHAAGCAALLWSAYPHLMGDIDATEHVLRNTAHEFGDQGPDYSFGYGRIDCYDAVKSLKLRIEPVSRVSAGCPRNVQRYEFSLVNDTGADATVDMTYSITGGDGLCGGPGSLGPIANGGSMTFDIFMYPDCSGGDSVTCTISLNSGSYSSMAIVINDCLFPGQDLCCDLAAFSDIPSGFWAEDFIYAVACEGITTGYADGTYRPAQNVQRSQMASFIIRALFGEDFSYSLMPHFSDVPSDHWAFRYIQKMYDEGITTGYADGTYRPAQSVQRSQMASFIIKAKYGDSFSYSPTPHFSDVPSDHWAFRYIQKMYDEGITSGYADGTFHPSENVSRAQMAMFIGRAFLSMR
jgi:subtilisin family serine protease